MIFLSSKVFLSREGTGTMPDQVRRLDFLLRSPNDAEAFIEDAVSGGFDVARYDITVNDRPYKMLRAELRDLCRVSLVVLVSVLASGVVLLFLVSFFYQTSKEKEKQVLLFSELVERMIDDQAIKAEIANLVQLKKESREHNTMIVNDSLVAFATSTASEIESLFGTFPEDKQMDYKKLNWFFLIMLNTFDE